MKMNKKKKPIAKPCGKRRAKLAPIFRLTIGDDLMPRLAIEVEAQVATRLHLIQW